MAGAHSWDWPARRKRRPQRAQLHPGASVTDPNYGRRRGKREDGDDRDAGVKGFLSDIFEFGD
jgi:hypothetical protein